MRLKTETRYGMGCVFYALSKQVSNNHMKIVNGEKKKISAKNCQRHSSPASGIGEALPAMPPADTISFSWRVQDKPRELMRRDVRGIKSRRIMSPLIDYLKPISGSLKQNAQSKSGQLIAAAWVFGSMTANLELETGWNDKPECDGAGAC